jgi:hypothetical protein
MYACMHACVCVCVCVCFIHYASHYTHYYITTVPLCQVHVFHSLCNSPQRVGLFFVSGGDRRQYVNALGTNSQKFSTLVHLQESHYREKLLRRCALRDILVSCVCVCV